MLTWPALQQQNGFWGPPTRALLLARSHAAGHRGRGKRGDGQQTCGTFCLFAGRPRQTPWRKVLSARVVPCRAESSLVRLVAPNTWFDFGCLIERRPAFARESSPPVPLRTLNKATGDSFDVSGALNVRSQHGCREPHTLKSRKMSARTNRPRGPITSMRQRSVAPTRPAMQFSFSIVLYGGIINNMPWVRAQLHGQVVYARAKPDGKLHVQGGRVEVCYSLNASRLYQARATNVVKDENAALLADDACVAKADSTARLKKATNLVAAARRIGVDAQGPQKLDHRLRRRSVLGQSWPFGSRRGDHRRHGAGPRSASTWGKATNNIAELAAIERVLDVVPDIGRPLVVYTDSAYAIGVLSKGWKAKANLEMIDRIRERLAKRPATRLVHVRGHAGIELNERADELAREAVRTKLSRVERVG